MTDVAPEPVHHDGLAAALFAAYVSSLPPGGEVGWTPPMRRWEEQESGTQAHFRGMAARLCADGVLTLLEVPEGRQPEAAAVTPGVIGHPIVDLSQAVRVLAISLGFLRDAGGVLVLAGQFVGNPKNDPDTDVASAWIMSLPAVEGLFRQVVEAAMAIDPMVGIKLAAAAKNAAVSAAPADGPVLYVPGNGNHGIHQ